MTELTREELVAKLQRLEEDYATLDERIQDIRFNQRKLSDQQSKFLDLLYTLDHKAGKETCIACFALLAADATICPECGEEQ